MTRSPRPPEPILVCHLGRPHPVGASLVGMSTARFRAQMAWLAKDGYGPVILRQVYDAWTGDGVLPAAY